MPQPIVNPGFARTMAAYNAEMNRRLYSAAGRLSDEARKAGEGAFWSSIHGTLNHILWADQVWLARFEERAPPPVAMADSATLFDDFASLQSARVQMDDAITAFARDLRQEWLEGDLTWMSVAIGRQMTVPRSVLVAHLFNHQTHHRGQAHALITRAGQRTGDTDMPFILSPDTIAAAMMA